MNRRRRLSHKRPDTKPQAKDEAADRQHAAEPRFGPPVVRRRKGQVVCHPARHARPLVLIAAGYRIIFISLPVKSSCPERQHLQPRRVRTDASKPANSLTAGMTGVALSAIARIAAPPAKQDIAGAP